MTFSYKTMGTCSQLINITVEGYTIEEVKFMGGCAGNLKGIGALVKGMHIDDAIAKLSGITCGFKGTSCPDQLAKALTQLQEEESF